jgi:hypothetical protein
VTVGLVDWQMVLGDMPLSFVSTVLFCNDSIITSRYICSHLVLSPDEEYDNGYSRFHPDMVKYQKKVLSIVDTPEGRLVSGLLPDLLREWERDKNQKHLNSFMYFITSYFILPDNEMITVEFSEEECDGMIHADAFPMAHTCNCLIKFPVHAYYGDKKKLEEKLLLAFIAGDGFLQMS